MILRHFLHMHAISERELLTSISRPRHHVISRMFIDVAVGQNPWTIFGEMNIEVQCLFGVNSRVKGHGLNKATPGLESSWIP